MTDPFALRIPITHAPTGAGICERCERRTRVRAVRLEAGVEQLCTNCHPAESTESTEPTPEG